MNRDSKTAFLRQLKILVDTNEPGVVSWLATMEKGFLVVKPDGTVVPSISTDDFSAATELYGIEPRKMNQTFFASVAQVRGTSTETRIYHQLVNYMTTYGASLVGLPPQTTLPLGQIFETPELNQASDISFTIIQQVGLAEAKDRLEKHVMNLRGLNPITQVDMENLMMYITVSPDKIQSFELLAMYCKAKNKMPTNITERLRLAVYTVTQSTLLVNSARTASQIKNYLLYIVSAEDKRFITSLLNTEELAYIFFKYKKIILAFKGILELCSVINAARRKADKLYVRTPETALIHFSQNILDEKTANVQRTIRKATTPELIKLLNFTTDRMYPSEASVYQVRNGKTYVKEEPRELSRSDLNNFRYWNTIIRREICNRLKRYRGVTFIVPDYINYALPTTDKQMVGPYPYGTSLVTPDRAYTLGIHWYNPEIKGQEQQTDLDFHMNSEDQHYGWNGWWRGEDSDVKVDPGEEVYFSGDMTNAPRPDGAAEAFYFNPNRHNRVFCLGVSKYSGPNYVPFTLFLSSEPFSGDDPHTDRHYFIDPNHLLLPPIPLAFQGDSRTQTIGLLKKDKFIFYGSATSGVMPNQWTGKLGKAAFDKLSGMYTLDSLAINLGCRVLDPRLWDLELPDPGTLYIDLRPEAIDNTTLLSLVNGTLEPKEVTGDEK